ncbi:MAG: DUF1684 domain-containing protein [Archangium sp.]
MRLAFLLIALTSCTSAYEKELDAFHAERTKEISAEWVTLVARMQLSEGDNAIVIPGYDGVLGTLNVTGSALTWNGAAISDDSKGEPTIFEHGSLRMHVITRGALHFLRVKDLEAPALKKFAGLSWYPAATKWKLSGTFEPAAPDATIEITNVLNQTAPQKSPGSVRFDVDGKTWRLIAIADDEPGFFLVFKDETSGHGTYPAGRFLHTSAPSADGSVTVDFNRAYSPPCAYTKFATCPLPPKGNALALKIEAGERGEAH